MHLVSSPPAQVTSYELFTSAEASPNNDPISWRLEGLLVTSMGSGWIEVDRQDAVNVTMDRMTGIGVLPTCSNPLAPIQIPLQVTARAVGWSIGKTRRKGRKRGLK